MNKVFRFLSLTAFVSATCCLPVTGIAQEDSAKGAEKKQIDEGDKVVTATGEGDKDAKSEQQKEPEIVPLTIGSPAPQLDIEHWIQDGSGHFAKVSEFEADRVYIVEFWATWCGPCIASMPHIAEIQEKYADRGVQVVSITREDVETVEKFLDREIRGAEDSEGENGPKTYRDLTSGYCLTADPDNSSSNDYMRAAGQSGIPCAFIVGKDAKIEWIGHPMSMDEPLEKIVSDQWNRDEYAAQFVAKREARSMLSRVSLLTRKGDSEEAVAVLKEYVDGGNLEKLDPQSVNMVTWRMYQMAAADQIDDQGLLRAALKASNKAVKDAGQGRPYLLDTVAHLKYELGNVKGALKSQRAAMKAADDDLKPRLKGFLEKLEEELAEPKQDPSNESDQE